MKKKLLVTLGCSITQGIGCYDYDINPEYKHWYDLDKEAQEITSERFLKLGWPYRTASKLGYHKLINLGSAGSSNSAHLKLFVDKVLPKIERLKKEYDILVIWLMTEPTRFSFYTDKKINLYAPAGVGLWPLFSDALPMESGYLEEMHEFNIGPLREQLFLIKMAEGFFKSLDVELLISSWAGDFDKIYDYYDSPRFLSPAPDHIKTRFTSSYMSLICGHPNDKGYELVSKQIFKLIKKHHPNLVNFSLMSAIDAEWLGDNNYELKLKPRPLI